MAGAGRTVEFIWDFVSTPCYIAWKCAEPVIKAAGGDVLMTPVLCGGIFKATGNAGPLGIPAKRDWYARDLALWAKRRGVPLVASPYIPIRSLPLMRGALLAEERGEMRRYGDVVFDAIYVHRRNLSDLAVVKETLRDAGLDVEAYLQGIDRVDIKERLTRNTERAIARGVFGVPSFFVGDELFFGQDRLDFVVEALHAVPLPTHLGQSAHRNP
jgi:2-hydroxychromene-2-carboxylate isomerase